MEHFNKANLKESDLMPSRFRTDKKDKTMTYRPLKSRFGFETKIDYDKKVDELNDVKITTTIRPRFHATNNIKEKEVINTFYVSRRNRIFNNTEKKNKNDDNFEVKYNAVVHRRQREVKNDNNNNNEKESKYASTKALFKSQTKSNENEPITVGRNRRFRSFETNVTNKNDDKGYKYSISSSISNTLNNEFNKGNNEKKSLKSSISSRFVTSSFNDNSKGLKSSISSSINYFNNENNKSNNKYGLKSSVSNKALFTLRTKENENNLFGKTKRLGILDNKEDKDNEQKINVNKSTANMVPRPFMGRRKYKSVTSLPLMNLTESINNKNIDDKNKDKEKDKNKDIKRRLKKVLL